MIGSSHHGSSFLQIEAGKTPSVLSLPSSRRGTLSSYSQLQTVPDTADYTLNTMTINRKSVTLGDIILEGKKCVCVCVCVRARVRV